MLLLLALFAARLTHTAIDKSLTADEPHYIGTGLYLWESGDYDFATTLHLHPPLAYHLASLPLLFFDLGGLERDRLVSRRLRSLTSPSAEQIRIASRAAFIALAIWGAALCFWWAREVAGDLAGLLAAFLYTFSPTMLAAGSLAHSDITAAVFFLQTLYTFWRWLARPTAARAVLCGVSLGLGLIAKSTGILLLAGIALLVAAVAFRPWPASPTLPWPGPDRLGRRLAWLVGVSGWLLASALAVFWLGYGGSFDLVAVADGRYPDVALPGYLQALLVDTMINEAGRVAFLLGEFSDRGWWYYFPVAYLLKEPVASIALLGAALVSLVRRRGRLGWLIGLPAALYLAMACFWLDIPLGLRYVLPLFPLSFVFTATQLVPVEGRRARAAVALAAAWLAIASLWIHPHYLASFNLLAGGPARGHRHLLDSNIDWGQDLSTLARFLRERGNPPVQLAYFGAEAPRVYGIRSSRWTGCEPVTGLVAISVNVMEGLYSARNPFVRPPPGCYDWLREHEPVALLGYSIRVYDVPES